MDTENRAFRLDRRSNYAGKTPRRAIQALRREIGPYRPWNMSGSAHIGSIPNVLKTVPVQPSEMGA